MTVPASSPTPPARKRSSKPKRRWQIIMGLLVVLALGLIGAGGWSAYQTIRQNRVKDRAQNFLAIGDYTQAAMSATWALQLDPKDPEATRVMAEVAAAQGQKQEIAWRARLVEFLPNSLEDRLKWAMAALNHDEVRTAQDALDGATAEQKKSAAYHEVAGRIAAKQRRGNALEASVEESVRLDPDNELYQLELAALRLGSQRAETRDIAREEIERLVMKAKTSRPALHVLIRDAMMRGDGPRALIFAEKLNALPEVVFEDRMTYLRLLRQMNRREFWWCLAQMQAEAAESENEIPALMTYLNKSGMPGATVLWGKKLPEAARTRSLVAVAMAEAFLMSKDWTELKAQVKFGNWKDLEFQRLALLARVAREEGDQAGASVQWKAAIVAAGTRRDDLGTLARLAMTWKWQEEANAALWQIARGPVQQMPALQSLSRNYQLAGNTRELLNVANRMVEIDQENLHARNNVAYLSLLLDVDRERAHALARDVYVVDSKNPAFASTYALALHLLGRPEGALEVLERLPPKSLEVPAHAFSYGLALAAMNRKEDAARYLSLAENSSILFPQEKTLIAKAREWLARP